MRRALLASLLVVAACSPVSTTNSTAPGPLDVSCEEPPSSTVEDQSALLMSVEPNPAEPRQTVTLTVSSAGLPDDALTGVDARWQCWNGEEWATTHAVYRGFGDRPGQTIQMNADFQIRVPSIGLELDQGFPIVIPQVEPGIYRIQDDVIVDEEPITGFVLVEVAEGRS